jgi:general secretion pathway protein D
MTRARTHTARLTSLLLAWRWRCRRCTASRRPRRSRAPVTVNFVNADIEAVTRAFAAMIDRQIAVDPRVRGTITVYSEQPQSVAEAYQGYLSALRGLGFAVVENGGLLKVVPEADAKLQTSTVSVGEVVARATRSSRRSSRCATRTRTTWWRCCGR